MNTQAYKSPHLRRLLAGIAGILVSGIAIASLAISTRGQTSQPPAAESHAPVAERAIAAPSGYRCNECGTIESARRIEIPDDLIQMHAPGRYAAGNRGENHARPGRYVITIRLQDGSMRVITDAQSAKWREGERVSLIGTME